MGRALYETETFFWLLEQGNQEGRIENLPIVFFDSKVKTIAIPPSNE